MINLSEVQEQLTVCTMIEALSFSLLLAGNDDSTSSTFTRQCTRGKGKQTIV